MNKLKTKMTALLLAILFMATCFVPLYGMTQARAAGGSTDDPQKDTLVYIGDNPQSKVFCETELDGMFENYELYYYERDAFETNFEEKYDEGQFDGIEDAYVIFEMQDTMGETTSPTDEDYLPNILLELFSTLKENGCKIMLIFGTDETRFLENNEFLDYVDIHINTDIFYLFICNVFMDMAEMSTDWKLEGVTFIFDLSMDSFVNGGIGGESMLFRYFMTVYKEEASDLADVVRILLGKNEVLIHDESGNTYYDVLQDMTVSFASDEFISLVDGPVICAAGLHSMSYDPLWLEQMFVLREMIHTPFPVYVYNTGEFSEYEGEALYLSGQLQDISHIMVEFLQGEDLSEYDNIEGRCEITHRPMTQSEDGWMEEISGDSPFAECWSCYHIKD